MFQKLWLLLGFRFTSVAMSLSLSFCVSICRWRPCELGTLFYSPFSLSALGCQCSLRDVRDRPVLDALTVINACSQYAAI
ncbi:hypothetical protein BGW80DRAFT_1330323 [Lactifluus volemus]|nr:hypothetical protein BGW80DRAFT_1330323 [Lactifluus volemus]